MRWCWTRDTKGVEPAHAFCRRRAPESLGRLRDLRWSSPAPADEPDQETERAGAGRVEHDVDGSAGAVGQEGLVELVATGDDGCREDGEDGGLEAPREQRHPPAPVERVQPGAEEREADRAIAGEVSCLAEKVVDGLPGAVGHDAE